MILNSKGRNENMKLNVTNWSLSSIIFLTLFAFSMISEANPKQESLFTPLDQNGEIEQISGLSYGCDYVTCMGDGLIPPLVMCANLVGRHGYQEYRVQTVFRISCWDSWGCYGCGMR
jgi:hypothetical protein